MCIRDSNELEALQRNAQDLFRDVVSHSPQLSDDLQSVAMNIDDPGRLADFIAGTLPSLSTLLRQELIETSSVRKRLETLIRELSKELEVLELRSKIHEQVQEQVSQSQREYLLREQMKAIQKELGESDDGAAEIDELRKKVEEAAMSAEAKKECDRELKRLAKMTPASAEYMVSRTYLEWMTSLPWSKSSGMEDIDIAKGKEILDEDHYDLVKVKERILDYLAVKKLQPGMKGPILCFVGPPGVGKTSLGKSIARALGRKFVRIALGGMHDEAEIRGHRRTYIGALPGQIIQGLKRAESNDPVCMLDEVDKLGRDFRGDPSSALMEVLDPEQNNAFRDHYLDVPFDLSKVCLLYTSHLALHRLDSMSSNRRLEAYQFVERFLAETPPEEVRPQRVLNGDDLLRMGYKPGPRFTEILRGVEDAQLEGQIADLAGAEAYVRQNYPAN